VLRKIAIDR